MILGSGAFGASALDGAVLRAALAEQGFERLLLVLRPEATPRALEGVPVEAVRTDWDHLSGALQLAARTRAPRVVLEPPALLGVERACRELFALARAHAGLAFALATPDKGALARPDLLAAVLDDLTACRVGWWHRPSRAQLLGQGDSSWLDALGRHLVGLSLDDVADGAAGLPPGLGGLDFSVVAECLTPGLTVALDLDPLPDPGLLRFARAQLQAKGIA